MADGFVIEQIHNRAVRSTGQFRSRGDVPSMERSYYEAFVLRGTTVVYIHFVTVGAWSILSFLMYATVTHIVRQRDRTRDLYDVRVNGLNHCFTKAPRHPSVFTAWFWRQARR